MLPLLIDLDGVLRINKQPAPKLEQLMKYIKDADLPACIISNSTLSTDADVKEFFAFHDVDCSMPVMTASSAAAIYAKQNYRHVAVYCTERIKNIFAEILDYDNPQAVVIGDYGKNWNFKTMNEIFLKVFNGADLIAMQEKRYWYTSEEGLLLDVGPFVKAIEYAAGKKATLIGKPSPHYFQSALKLLKFPEDAKFIMVGDDLETDILGAQKLGATTILMFSGITKRPLPADSHVKSDYEADDLEQLIGVLETLN